jgi:putative hydrolase of the HAD superfamily
MDPILKKKRQIVVFLPYRKKEGGLHEFFLQKRDRAAPVHAEMYSLFGGGIDNDEAPPETLRREMWEELRYEPRNARYLAHCSSGYGDFFVFVEEVAPNFESRIEIREGVNGTFFTYNAVYIARDVSPIARVATEAAHWYLDRQKDTHISLKGASNLGFQVIIPKNALERLRVPDAEIMSIDQLPHTLSQTAFSDTTHIFFDLDGTLHDFRHTARMAMDNVYEKIGNDFSLNRNDLEGKYAEIIAAAEKQGFAEGKTSEEYRTGRFSTLMGSFSKGDAQYVAALVKLYGDSFEENIRLDASVLQTLQELLVGYKMSLITEGPLDAQLRTIEKLGLGPYFQDIFTSGEYGQIKETGELFITAQNKLHLTSREIVIVGDSPSRDIKGAHLAGMRSILTRMFVR